MSLGLCLLFGPIGGFVAVALCMLLGCGGRKENGNEHA